MTILPNYIAEHASTPALLILLYVAATGFTIGLQIGYFKDRKELFGSKLVNAHLAFTIVGTLTFALFSAMMWLWAAKYSETINQRANRLTYGLCAIFLLRDLPLFAIEYTAILNEGWRDAYQGFAFIMTLLFFLLSGVYSWLNYLWFASRYLNSIFGAYSSGGGLKTGSEKLVVLRPASPTEVHSWDRELLPPPGSARRGGAIDFSAVNSKRGSAANSRMGTPSRGGTAIDNRYSPPPLSSLSSGAGRRGQQQQQFADGHPSESNRNAYSHGRQQQMSSFPYTTVSPVTGNGNNNFNSIRGPHSSSDSPRRYDSPRTNGAALAGWGDNTNDTNYNTTGGAADSAADHHYSPPPLPQQSYSPDHTNRHQGSPQNNYLPPRSHNNERSYRGDGADGSGLAHHHQLPATFGGGGEVEQQLAMLRARQQRGGGRRSRRGSVASSGGGGGGGYTTANSNQLYSNTGNTSQFNSSNYYNNSNNTNNNNDDDDLGGVRGYDGFVQPLSASVNVNGQSPSRLQVGSPARGVIRMEGTLSGPSSHSSRGNSIAAAGADILSLLSGTLLFKHTHIYTVCMYFFYSEALL